MVAAEVDEHRKRPVQLRIRDHEGVVADHPPFRKPHRHVDERPPAVCLDDVEHVIGRPPFGYDGAGICVGDRALQPEPVAEDLVQFGYPLTDGVRVDQRAVCGEHLAISNQKICRALLVVRDAAILIQYVVSVCDLGRKFFINDLKHFKVVCAARQRVLNLAPQRVEFVAIAVGVDVAVVETKRKPIPDSSAKADESGIVDDIGIVKDDRPPNALRRLPILRVDRAFALAVSQCGQDGVVTSLAFRVQGVEIKRVQHALNARIPDFSSL